MSDPPSSASLIWFASFFRSVELLSVEPVEA
ncbi:hypothetical protein A2U01_0109687, partial [Trifolium medium]|nr:hypothetical protein [Trifolium medium]